MKRKASPIAKIIIKKINRQVDGRTDLIIGMELYKNVSGAAAAVNTEYLEC